MSAKISVRFGCDGCRRVTDEEFEIESGAFCNNIHLPKKWLLCENSSLIYCPACVNEHLLSTARIESLLYEARKDEARLKRILEVRRLRRRQD